MAARKPKVEVGEIEKTKIVQPTRDEIEQAVVWMAMHTNRVPCLVGPTASGKTRMAMKIAAEREAKLITILLQQDTPEEIAGFQAPIGDRLLALTPYWFDRAQKVLDDSSKVVLFFDELGLSHEATRGAIYTFLRDREIRGKSLSCAHASVACPECVLVIAAMNPAELAPPMLSRIAMFHVPMDRQHMIGLASTDLARRIARIAPIAGKHPSLSNDPPPPPTTYDLSAQAVVNKFDRAFWNLPEGTRSAIVTSILPPALIEEVFREDTLSTPSIAQQVKRPELIIPIMKSLSPPDAAVNAMELWRECSKMATLAEAKYVIVAVTEALSMDEEKQSLFMDMSDEDVNKWWQERSPEESEELIALVESEELLVFDPEKPRGRLLDNYLMQAPPAQNEMTHLMSPEALAQWKSKYGVE